MADRQTCRCNGGLDLPDGSLWVKPCPVHENRPKELTVQNPQGFTPELKSICRETCAEFGDPPCWKLPELVQPCELITPCADCLAALKGGARGED